MELAEDSPEMQQLREFKHDVKNQLSNMYLAIDQLRFEVDKMDDKTFAAFCVDTIANSCAAINKQLEKVK